MTRISLILWGAVILALVLWCALVPAPSFPLWSIP